MYYDYDYYIILPSLYYHYCFHFQSLNILNTHHYDHRNVTISSVLQIIIIIIIVVVTYTY